MVRDSGAWVAVCRAEGREGVSKRRVGVRGSERRSGRKACSRERGYRRCVFRVSDQVEGVREVREPVGWVEG